jgi:hypothetical protein
LIHELDESIERLLKRDALNGADVEIVFDAPTKDWSARRNTPTLDVYLYDIREDLRWRHYGEVDIKGADNRTTGRAGPPRFYKFSYLITAWTQRPEDEHRLLSAVLFAFLRQDVIPREVLTDTLADLGHSVRVTIALPPPEDRSLSDVWSALGGELKPSLDLVCLLPIDSRGISAVGPLVLEEPKFNFGGEVVAAGGQRRRGQRTIGTHDPDREIAEERVEAGKPNQRGRIFTIRDSPVPPERGSKASESVSGKGPEPKTEKT